MPDRPFIDNFAAVNCTCYIKMERLRITEARDDAHI